MSSGWVPDMPTQVGGLAHLSSQGLASGWTNPSHHQHLGNEAATGTSLFVCLSDFFFKKLFPPRHTLEGENECRAGFLELVGKQALLSEVALARYPFLRSIQLGSVPLALAHATPALESSGGACGCQALCEWICS